MNSFAKVGAAPTIIMISLLLAACGSQTKSFQTDGGNGTITVNNDGGSKVVFSGKDGQSTVNMTTGKNASYPASCAIPQYPGSKCTMCVDTGGSSKDASQTIQLSTSDEGPKVVEYYKNWFNSNGWKINAEATVSGMCSIVAQKDDLTATAMAMGSGNDKMINLTIAHSH